MKGKNSLQFDDRGKTDIDDLDISKEAKVKFLIPVEKFQCLI